MKRSMITAAVIISTFSLLTVLSHGQPPGSVELGAKVVKGLEIEAAVGPPFSQEEMMHMMKQMQEMGMKMDESMMKMMVGADHRLVVWVREAETKKFIPGLEVTVTARGPKGEKSFKLMGMSGSYGEAFMAPDKGKYNLLVRVKGTPGAPVKVRTAEAAFQFENK